MPLNCNWNPKYAHFKIIQGTGSYSDLLNGLKEFHLDIWVFKRYNCHLCCSSETLFCPWQMFFCTLKLGFVLLRVQSSFFYSNNFTHHLYQSQILSLFLFSFMQEFTVWLNGCILIVLPLLFFYVSVLNARMSVTFHVLLLQFDFEW